MGLTQALVFLAAVVIAVPLFKRLGLGSVLGYLAAGVVLGPSVLGFITDVESIFHLAELGVVLLLFAGPPAAFPHVRRRIGALWDRCCRQCGVAAVPAIGDQRIELGVQERIDAARLTDGIVA